eukprot:scaffold269388_cov55-Attheya_sp.AAC.1
MGARNKLFQSSRARPPVTPTSNCGHLAIRWRIMMREHQQICTPAFHACRQCNILVQTADLYSRLEGRVGINSSSQSHRLLEHWDRLVYLLSRLGLTLASLSLAL